MGPDLHKVSISQAPVSRIRSILIPLLVFGICMGVTWLAWRSSTAEQRRESETYFEFRVRDAQIRIEQRLKTYEQVLRDTHAMLVTAPVNRKDFARFVSAMHLPQNYPGIQGVGFSPAVLKADLAQHTETIKKEGFPAYAIRPAGDRDLYTPVIFLEPFEGRNLRAFGYDMYSEPIRRAAMDLARDLNDVTISGKVTLVQETDQDRQVGFLMYVPVFNLGRPPTDAPFAEPDQRRANIKAWIYAPFRMNDLMAGVFGERGGDLDIEIHDGTEPSPDNLMFASVSSLKYGTGLSEFSAQRRMEFGHRTWTLRAQALPGFGSRIGTERSGMVLGAGLLLSSLLALLVWNLVGSRSWALRLAAEQESYYKMLMQEANDSILVITLDGTILTANARAADHFRYSQEELQGLSVGSLHAPDSLGEVQARFRKTADTGAARFETEHLRKDGSRIQSEVSATVMDYQGTRAMLCIVHDISHRKTQEKALRESEARFRTMFESHSAVMLLVDPEDGRIVDANPAAASFYGYARERLDAMHISDLNVLPQSEIEAAFRSAAEQKRNTFMFPHRIANGEIRQVEVNSSPMKILERKLLFSIIADVTEQLRTRQELDKVLREQQIILENANVGFSRIIDRRQVWINQWMVDTFQYSREEQEGHTTRMLYSTQEDYDRLGQDAYPILARGEPYETVQELVRKDGGHLWIHYNGRAIDTSDRGKGTLWVLTDVTSQRQAQEALKESEARFRILADTAPALIWMSGLDKLRSWFNQVWLDWTGRTMEQEEGDGWAEGVHPDDLPRCLETYVTRFDAREAFELEYRLHQHSGDFRWILERGCPRVASDGTFLGYMGVCIDIHEQKQAEKALSQSERFLDKVIEQSPHAMWIGDGQGTLIRTNQAHRDLFHVTDTELVGIYNLQQDPILAEQGHTDAIREVFEQGRTARFTLYYNTDRLDNLELAQHTQVFLDATVSPVLGPDGCVTNVIVQLLDLTERQQAEEEYRRSEAKFKDLIDVALIPFALNSPEGKIPYVNPAFTIAFGYTTQDIPDLESWWQKAYPDPGYRAWVVTAWGERLARAERDGCDFEPLEVEIRCRDGAQRFVLATSVVLKDLHDATHLVSLFDITDRKRAEEALARESARYRSIVNIAQDGIHLLDDQGRLLECNDAFMSSLGRQGEDPTTLRVHDWEAQIPEGQLEETILALIAKPSAFETRHRRKDGSIFDVEVNAGGIVLDGKPHLLAASRNISARKQAELEIATRQTQLEDLNRSLEVKVRHAVDELRQKDQMLTQQSRMAAMGEMIGHIAHQWRQPLSALSVLLGNLRDAFRFGDQSPEALADTFARGNALIQKMSSTITDFRNFNMPDKAKVPFSALHQIATAQDLVAASFGSLKVRLQVEAEKDVELFGFPNEFSQVLINILSNARQAIQESGLQGGEIHISLDQVGDKGRIRVRDTGGGIPAGALGRVFEPFFTTRESGSGIGLYMSKQIIEGSMNGSLKARNVDGGAEFEILLPCSQGSR